MIGMTRRERILCRSDGTLLIKDDPSGGVPAEELLVMIGGVEVPFLYDISVVDQDEHGREKIVAWYREVEGEDE
jgi:hypothetical protein